MRCTLRSDGNGEARGGNGGPHDHRPSAVHVRRREGDARRSRPPRRAEPAVALGDLPRARYREEHAPPHLRRARGARLGCPRRRRSLRARHPGAPPRLVVVGASDRHGVQDGGGGVPHASRRDDRTRDPRWPRVALRRARGDVAARPPGDARRLQDPGVRVRERPRRPGFASLRPRWRRCTEGSCSSLRPAGDSTASPSSSRSSPRSASAATRRTSRRRPTVSTRPRSRSTNGEQVTLAALTTLVPMSRVTPERRELIVADLRALGTQLSELVDWLPSFSSRRP